MKFSATGECSSRAEITKVFVVRRRLKFAPIKVCKLAHSAVILRTEDNKECVLEYLKDGKAHLYDANPTTRLGCKNSIWGKKFSKCNYFMKVSLNKNCLGIDRSGIKDLYVFI